MSIASGTSWNNSRAVLCRNNTASTLTWNIGNNSTSKKVNTNASITLNTWTHIAATYDGSNLKIYLNGILDNTTTANLGIIYSNTLVIGAWTTNNNYPFNGKINDVRIYNHCLSAKEIEEIAKGLVLHYPLNRKNFNFNSTIANGENLFIGSGFTSTDYDDMVVNSDLTNLTKCVRWYNGGKTNHTFIDGIDTIKLNSKANLGICFFRPATDINLDSTSNYTISCEAKCTKSGAELSIGRSYYTTGNSWTWRGGENKVKFSAVNTWQTFTLTFKPDANTKYICYCFTVYGAANSTDTFSIRHCKLEKGSTATPWDLNQQELGYTGINNTENLTTCYDTSGFNNNGIIVGNLNFSLNAPIFDSKVYFPGLNNLIKLTPFYFNTENWTVSFWYYHPLAVSSTWNSFICLSKDTGTDTNKKFALMFNNGYANHLWCKANSGSARVFPIKVNTWTHLTLTSEGKVYENGVLKSSTINPGANMTGTYDLVIGSRSASAGIGTITTQYTGNISDVRIYATALTAN
jgi:hypothetical protein